MLASAILSHCVLRCCGHIASNTIPPKVGLRWYYPLHRLGRLAPALSHCAEVGEKRAMVSAIAVASFITAPVLLN